ncbi:MAG: hypothetical protein US76_02425 [Parcubacteria group bacterium GW2011_GWA2_38_13b]|nr:MAG: hypothetical protein US76_02425 [Parcubacteria group bacterium GW2011_GWA2_38_13b]
MNPIITWLQRKKIPRILGVLIIYMIGIFILASIVYLILPPLAQEIRDFSGNFPESFDRIPLFDFGGKFLAGEKYPEITENIKAFLGNISEKLETFSSGIISTTINIFGGIVSGILVFVISFYLAVQEEGIKNFFRSITPLEHQLYIFHLWSRVEFKMGRWFRGQLLLCLIVGTLVFIGLSVFHIKYSLILAIIAALLELIPYIGPVIAAIPAIIIGLSQSFVTGLWIIGIYWLIQQTENHILVPKIMQRAVSLNPVIIIISMLIGIKLGGIIGIIIAVPIAAILVEFFYDFTSHEYWKYKEK